MTETLANTAPASDGACPRLGGASAIRAMVDRFCALLDAPSEACTGMAQHMVNTGKAVRCPR